METNYIISQVFVAVAMLCLGISYLIKDKKKIMILCILYSVFYGGQYLLLGAITGFAMNIVSIIRNIWFYINAKKNKSNSRAILIVLWVIAIVSGVLTFKDFTSLIPIAASILFTYSVWQDNNRVYKFMALPISALWISYNVFFKSIFGIIAELVLLMFEIIGIIKLLKKEKSDSKEKEVEV